MKRTIQRLSYLAGFTLVEMLLVLVIVSMIVVMGMNYIQQKTLDMRVDRTVNQMQQILNAGLSYYVVNSVWPLNLSALQTNGAYLPNNAILSPWHTSYVVVPSLNTSGTPATPAALLYVYVPITYASSSASAPGVANMIAGRLPLSYVTSAAPSGNNVPANNGSCQIGSSSQTCYVVAAVNIPGRNLNNATAVNYAGVYHSGSCVPVPSCPVDQNGLAMVAQIMVVPSSVSGVNDAPSGSCTPTNLSGCQVNVYPISSFTAKAVPYTTATAGGGPASCDGTQASAVCYADGNNTVISDGNNYWRVCLSAVTAKGAVNPSANTWGQLEGSVMAITRCASQGEKTGSNFNVWSK